MDAPFPTDPLNPADAAPDAALDDQTPTGGVTDDAPQDAAAPAATDPAAELARLQGQYQQAQTQLESERQTRTQYEQQLANHQRQLAENAARQFAQAEADLQAALPTMDPDDAVRTAAQFYKAQNQILLQNYQQVQQQSHQERVNAFAAHVAKETGLTDADARQLLMTPGAYQDPNVMVTAAQTIKQSRETQGAETKRLQQEIDNLKRQMAGNGMKPAWQTGGSNGGAPSANVYDPKSPDYNQADHYLALMRQGRPA